MRPSLLPVRQRRLLWLFAAPKALAGAALQRLRRWTSLAITCHSPTRCCTQVNAVEDVVDELDDFISNSCGKFASWRGMDGEQELEWTTLHQASAYS